MVNKEQLKKGFPLYSFFLDNFTESELNLNILLNSNPLIKTYDLEGVLSLTELFNKLNLDKRFISSYEANLDKGMDMFEYLNKGEFVKKQMANKVAYNTVKNGIFVKCPDVDTAHKVISVYKAKGFDWHTDPVKGMELYGLNEMLIGLVDGKIRVSTVLRGETLGLSVISYELFNRKFV